MLLKLPGQGTLLDLNAMARCNNCSQIGKGIAVAQRHVLKNVIGRHNLEILL